MLDYKGHWTKKKNMLIWEIFLIALLSQYAVLSQYIMLHPDIMILTVFFVLSIIIYIFIFNHAAYIEIMYIRQV